MPAISARMQKSPARERRASLKLSSESAQRARLGADLLDLDLGAPHRVLHRLLALSNRLADHDLADYPGLLADHGLLARGEHLDRLVLEGGFRLLGAQLAVRRLALGCDLLLAQGHGLLDRPLADVRGDAHAAGRGLALADRELLLDLLHGLALLGTSPPRLVALDDRHRLVDLLVGRLREDQGLAAASRFA